MKPQATNQARRAVCAALSLLLAFSTCPTSAIAEALGPVDLSAPESSDEGTAATTDDSDQPSGSEEAAAAEGEPDSGASDVPADAEEPDVHGTPDDGSELVADAETPTVTDGWTQVDTCEWRVDEAGCLVLRPAEGQEQGVLSEAPSWADCGASAFRADGSVKVTCNGLFSGFESLKTIDLSNIDFSSLEDASSMFFRCKSLESINWGSTTMPAVSRASAMFYGCSSLSSIDLSFLSRAQLYTMDSMFGACSKLCDINLSALDLSHITTLSGTFANCSSLRALDLSPFAASPLESLRCAFLDCASLESIDFGQLDMSSVEDMSSVLSGCTSLTDVRFDGVDASSVYTMDNAFSGCESLKNVDFSNVSKPFTPQPHSMSGLFSHCDSLETVNLRGLETRKGYYSPALWFDGCDSLKQVTIGSEFASSLSLPKQSGSSGRWVSSVDGVAYKSDELPSGMEVTYTVQFVDDYGKTWMQAGTCAWRVEDETLHIAPLPGCDNGTLRYGDLRLGNDWDSFSQSIKHVIFASGVSAYTCEGMFKDFRNLQDVDFSGLDASTTTSMSYMFSGCEALEAVDLSSLGLSSVRDLSRLFSGCSSLRSVTLGGNASAVTDMSYMFSGCEMLKTVDLSPIDLTPVQELDGLFQGCASLSDVVWGSKAASAIDISRMFSGCASMTNVDLSSISSDQIQSASGLFSGCESLHAADLSQLKLSAVKDLSSLFSGCSSLQNIVWGDSTSSATNIASMFYGCSELKSIDTSHLITDNVENMSRMFADCASLVDVDLSGFHTSRVKDMSRMFSGASSLKDLDLTSFDTSWVSDASNMFADCDSLHQLDLSSFDTSRMSSMSGMFGYSTSLGSLKLGEKFSLSGIRQKPQCSLPTYKKDGGAVLWINSRGDVFEPDAIPANVADTYHAAINLEDGRYVSIVSRDSSYVYTGSAIKPVFDTQLVEGTDYRIECSNNVNAGAASVDLIGIGDYTGTLHFEYEISKAVPAAQAPTEVVASRGQHLRDISLPDGWAWDNPDDLIDFDEGWRYGMTATYTPSDTTNYQTATAMIPIHVLPQGKWVRDAAGWWWRNPDGTYPKSDWKLIDGSWYLFDGAGYMATGWQSIGGTWYYLGSDGTMRTGWGRVGRSWYWFDASGAMVTGWRQVGGTWYYFNGSGAMATGWVNAGGTWYWMDASGAMVTGWANVGGTWYYFDASGAMVINSWVGNYYLTGSGAMATSQWVGPWWVGSDGCWRG